MRLFFGSADGALRTLPQAHAATGARFRIDLVRDERLAHPCRTPSLVDMRQIFVVKIAQRRQHRVRRSGSQRAQRTFRNHRTQFFEELQVTLLSFAIADAPQYVLHLCQPFAARYALATRFVHQEGHEIAGNIDHARPFVHDDHAARPHHRSGIGQALEVDWQIQQARRNASAGGPSRLHRLECLPTANPSADVEDQITEGDSHRYLDKPRVVHLPDQRKHRSALTVIRTNTCIPLRTAIDDMRHVCPRLDIVQVCRTVPQPALHRVHVFRTRLPCPSFDRRYQRSRLAAHERPATTVDLDIEIES